MAAFYGNNYKRTYIDKGKYQVGEYNGHVKCMFDEIILPSEITSGDTISIGKLPVGARVKNVRVKSEALSAGTFSVGHTGYVADASKSPALAAKAAAAAGFLAATSFASAGQADGIGADIGFKFLAETEVQLACTVTTTSGTGKKIQCWVEYIVD